MKNNQGGYVLIACVLVAILVMASALTFHEWVRSSAKSNVHRIAMERALNNADSGIYGAMEWLRRPRNPPSIPVLQVGIAQHLTSLTNGATYYLSLTLEPSGDLVDVISTGYYYMPQGAFVDTLNGNRTGQRAVIEARIKVQSVGDYLAAVPTSLEVGYGTDSSNGKIYAPNLKFAKGVVGPDQTRIQAAFYLQTVEPMEDPDWVTFTGPVKKAIRLPHPLTLPELTATLHDLYKTMAGSDILAPGARETGVLDNPANPYHVYFVDGDLHLGDGIHNVPFRVNGRYIIYVGGTLFLDHSVLLHTTGSWAGFLAEQNILVTADAPDVLELNGTFISNGQLAAVPPSAAPARSAGDLTFKGGMVMGDGINLAQVYAFQRHYSFAAAPSELRLPFLTQIMAYRVLEGSHVD